MFPLCLFNLFDYSDKIFIISNLLDFPVEDKVVKPALSTEYSKQSTRKETVKKLVQVKKLQNQRHVKKLQNQI